MGQALLKGPEKHATLHGVHTPVGGLRGANNKPMDGEHKHKRYKGCEEKQALERDQSDVTGLQISVG